MRRHFSMIRDFHLADVFTLANGACGTAAVLFAMDHMRQEDAAKLYAGAFFVALALAFDIADGRVARWRHRASAMGRELDSLADVISFGVAPAALGFAAGLRGVFDVLALLYFVCCGISRLARYNITAESMSAETGKVAYFEGTPIPSSVLLVAGIVALTRAGAIGLDLPGGIVSIAGGDLHALSLVYVASGSLMISKTLHIPKP